ncbi:helix-turn-helix domain-containing protein [Aliarcobacter cryaerophilus]|uniref:helix-turn-helix domain-containing protein n=1 Tax=Aliarcobacter cryaerophilus TaxID=28198 RepID=UPI003DA37BA9
MNAKNVLDKIKIALECDTYIDIANALNVTAGAVDNWKKRNAIPNKYLLKVTEDTGVSLDWLLSEDKLTFHISGGTKNISQVNGGIINQGSEKENELELFDESNPVFISFKKAYECVKNKKNKLNELEDLLEDFYRKYR